MVELIDGKKYSQGIMQELAKTVATMQTKPCLAVVLVGNNPASEIYVKNKMVAAEKVGFESRLIRLDDAVSEEALLQKIHEMNNDSSLHGFIVQLPLPKHINPTKVIDAISPLKDADGFTTTNLGDMLVGKEGIVPATPKGILYLLEKIVPDFKGKNAVVIGTSNIVGKPTGVLLSNKKATVTMCNSKTQNISYYLKNADIIVVAVGKPNMVTKEQVKEGVIVIDVGTNRLPDGTMCGDVALDVSEKASFITPVPGGVGPMTIAMLLKNTIECMHRQNLK